MIKHWLKIESNCHQLCKCT